MQYILYCRKCCPGYILQCRNYQDLHKWDCPYTNRKCEFIPLDLNIITKQGIGALNASAECIFSDNLNPCKVTGCNGIKTEMYNLTSTIFFELSIEEKMNIHEIPQQIKLGGRYYRLLSIIDYIPPICGNVGHYRANCLRINGKFTCFDDMKTRVTKSQQFLIPHCLIFTV